MEREKVIKEFEHLLNAAKGNYQDFVDLTVDGGEEIFTLLNEQEQMYYTLEHDWRMCRELLKEQEEEIENLKQTCQSMMEGAYLLKEQDAETGHWIYKKYDDMFMCSCCEKYSIRNDYPYCHWCGAKMEGR